MKQEDVLIENWNNLRVRILDAHPRRRPKELVLVSLDEEFKRLARCLLKLQISRGSYKIIDVDHSSLTRGHIALRSRDGHVVNLHENDYELFQRWVDMPDEDKFIAKSVHKYGYRLKETKPEVKKPNRPLTHHEVREGFEPDPDDDAGDM